MILLMLTNAKIMKHGAMLAAWLVAGCAGNLGDSPADEQAAGPGAMPGTPPGPGGGAGPGTAPTVSPPPGTLDPGRVSMRRLTPVEYRNTVRDLLETDTTGLLQGFPADGRSEGDGFDNIATNLGVASNQLEMFQSTAGELARRALAADSPARARYFTCAELANTECQSQILSNFASQAWRRPATPEEVQELLQLSSSAALSASTPEQQLEVAFEAVLTSPLFLFRIEFDPDPASLTPHPVGQYELASRLSYFLWSSMPDQQLFDLASQDLLHDPQQLNAQVTRMLADEKAMALTESFARQWLSTYRLFAHEVDENQFPDYDQALRDSMLKQTDELFSRVLQSDLPISQFLTSNQGAVDTELGEFYGVSGSSDANGMVDLSGTPRADLGLLGHASVLTLTSYPTRTSAVRRGIWVMENLLCEAPPSPPDGVDTELKGPLEGTVRERLEQHRADPVCAGCHKLMDPIGLSLENFDAVGQFRETENGEPIDVSGELLGRGNFLGPKELSQLLVSDPRFPKCMAQKLMTFALGRATDKSDAPYLAQIGTSAGPDPTLTQLVTGIITSEPFLMRRGEN